MIRDGAVDKNENLYCTPPWNQCRRQKSVADAMNNIQNAPGDEILSTHEEMVDRLAMETVKQEARLETITTQQGSNVDKLVALVKENKVIQSEMKVRPLVREREREV